MPQLMKTWGYIKNDNSDNKSNDNEEELNHTSQYISLGVCACVCCECTLVKEPCDTHTLQQTNLNKQGKTLV